MADDNEQDGGDATSAPAAADNSRARGFPNPIWLIGGVVAVVAATYALIQRAGETTEAIARWVAVAIFIGYTALTLTLLASVIIGAVKKEWTGPVMALVRNSENSGVSLSRLQALLWTAL